MASPFSTTTKSFNVQVDDLDSGFGAGQDMVLPHGGEAAAARPPGLSTLSQSVITRDEHGGRATLESAVEDLTLLPAVLADTVLASVDGTAQGYGSLGTPGSTGAATMAALEQEQSPQDMKIKLAENVNTILHLHEQLDSSTKQKERMQLQFQVERDKYETEIAERNAEIEKLNNKVDECRAYIASLEKTKFKEREKYESQIEDLQKKVDSKEEEISRIKEDFENMRLKFENDKSSLKLEIKDKELIIARMKIVEHSLGRDLAVAEKTIAENKAATMKVELDRKQVELDNQTTMTEKVQAELDKKTTMTEKMQLELDKKDTQFQEMAERLNSYPSSSSMSSDSCVRTERFNSASSDSCVRTERFNSASSYARSRSDSMRQSSDSGTLLPQIADSDLTPACCASNDEASMDTTKEETSVNGDD